MQSGCLFVLLQQIQAGSSTQLLIVLLLLLLLLIAATDGSKVTDFAKLRDALETPTAQGCVVAPGKAVIKLKCAAETVFNRENGLVKLTQLSRTGK
jgi:hypothetical protein